MNFIDIAILLVLGITILGGLYRGFVSTVYNVGATVVSLIVARVFIPLVSSLVKGSADLFNMMLYYTEGSEYVAITDVELTRASIASISSDQLHAVLQNADMPIPMDRCVIKNIAQEAFHSSGVTTLGDYFNQTIVCVVINILAMLLVFIIVRLLLGFVIRGMEYGRGGFPVLTRGDGIIGAGLGLIHGVLLLFAIFLLVPVMLTVLPKLYEFLSESFFGEFFYKANFLLSLIPAT
ncbi:MAG TPA: CvpA family protein [Candidatus Cryosericum sp.]|nr:CvpA family protein [Candidatus Cryosericum sp.]